VQTAVEWLAAHVPVREDEAGRFLRWTSTEGRVQEAELEWVADRYATQIERAQQTGEDVLELVLAEGPDAGWHDIWRRWRELGFI